MRTEQILRYMEKKERERKRRKAIWKFKREILRFSAQFIGTSIFIFIVIPIMEYRPERTLIICEALICLMFSLWLGNKIYNGKRRGI